jgi:hypothetical protein
MAAFSGASPAWASGPGVGNVPQGTQSDAAYAASFALKNVTNVFATTQQVSCYRPEVSAAQFNDGPNDGYSGESACPSTGATTGENTGAAAPYATQSGSRAGYPMSGPQLVKDHSESDLRVDPVHSKHLIGSSKWIVSAEGYNHLLGFYESFDGGKSWPVQGHIPGYEGWTDNTDPIGAFDGFGNFYELILPYQFTYDSNGHHDFNVGGLPNPSQPSEAITVSVHPWAATPSAGNWITTHNGAPDVIVSYDSVGNAVDKQWLTIDANPTSPHYNRVYAMWVDFRGPYGSIPWVSYADARSNGTHSDWSQPAKLPFPPISQGVTYLLPHVAPNGDVYTTVTNAPNTNSGGHESDAIFLDKSTDGGASWITVSTVVDAVTPPPLIYPNTTFRDGIENTFAVGNQLDAQGLYPLYVAYEDFSAGVDNVILTVSYDGGSTWSAPIQVNDNAAPVDEFQPNLAVTANGTVSVNFYDRRLACPAAGTAEAAGAGIALDQKNPHYSGALPPYDAKNYCVNASVQFYKPNLVPMGHNIRLTEHTWDGQLNAPHPSTAFNNGYTFIGDYFGNTSSGNTSFASFVSTYNDTTKPSNQQNPSNRQQQVVATLTIPSS